MPGYIEEIDRRIAAKARREQAATERAVAAETAYLNADDDHEAAAFTVFKQAFNAMPKSGDDDADDD